MSPSEKLAAAAEKIADLLADAAVTSPLPWSDDKDECFVDDAADFHVGELATPVEAELVVTAVNAMPAIAKWLKCAGEDLATDADAFGKDQDDYISNIPFYRLAVAVADQILGGA